MSADQDWEFDGYDGTYFICTCNVNEQCDNCQDMLFNTDMDDLIDYCGCSKFGQCNDCFEFTNINKDRPIK